MAFDDTSAKNHAELYDILRQEGYHVEDSTSYNDEGPSLVVMGEFNTYQFFVPDQYDFKEYQLLVEGDPEFENRSLDGLLDYFDERFQELENPF